METLLTPQLNAIGFVRLALASCVLFAHGVALAGYGYDTTLWGLVAVRGFFFLSGLLVAQSFEHCRHAGDFLWRRALRIYPGYWANLLVIAFLVIPIFWMLRFGSLEHYWNGPNGPVTYVIRSAALLFGTEDGIRNIFGSNPVTSYVNASLWTLPFELLCYIGLAALGTVGAIRRKFFSPLLALFFFFFWVVRPEIAFPDSIRKMTDPAVIELYLIFTLGVCVYVFREKVKILPWLGWLCSAVTLLLMWRRFGFMGEVIRPFLVAYLMLWICTAIPIRHFERHGDISYGLYIYAFPINQGLVLLKVNHSPLLYFVLLIAITVGLSMASGFIIESPALKLKRLFSPRRMALVSAQAEGES